MRFTGLALAFSTLLTFVFPEAQAFERLNFHDEFCRNVETTCSPDASSVDCLAKFDQKAIKRTTALKTELKKYDFFFMRGLGGKEIDPNDYYNHTSRQALIEAGVNSASITIAEPYSSLTECQQQAANYCQVLAQKLKNSPNRPVIVIGHSRAGRILLLMQTVCPTIIGSEQVSHVLISQGAFGASATANLSEQLNSKRWWDAFKLRGKAAPLARILSKGAAIISPDLGYSVDEAYPGLLNPEACPSCRDKYFTVTSTWSKSCDSRRVLPATDTSDFVQVRDGNNDGRLPLESQRHRMIPNELVNAECALHSDFFKRKMLPEKNLCQKTFNLYLFEKLLKAKR